VGILEKSRNKLGSKIGEKSRVRNSTKH